MLSRALSIATVTLLIGCLTAGVARAVENLDAGKSPSQIFSNTCSACHKSPRGLLKNVSASSLPGFLRQHYTTGTDMAAVLVVLPDLQRGRRSRDIRARISRSRRTPNRTEGRISPIGSGDGSRRPHLRRRLPGRTPTEHRRKVRARVQAETRSDWHGRIRPKPPNLQMGRLRCRPRPTANRASGRRAGVASP